MVHHHRRVYDSLTQLTAHCKLLVDMPQNFPTTRASWWDIWTAGVAISTMCARDGRAGTVSNLGKSISSRSRISATHGGRVAVSGKGREKRLIRCRRSRWSHLNETQLVKPFMNISPHGRWFHQPYAICLYHMTHFLLVFG